MKDTIFTKFGNARLSDNGYYKITSGVEGNNGKYLHRLIYEDYHNVSLPKNVFVHHIDGDKTNNSIDNLEAINSKEHVRLHHKGKIQSKETIAKRVKHYKDVPRTPETKLNISKTSNNSTGVMYVHKQKRKNGFVYRYTYQENGKNKTINSIDFKKLMERVISRGFEWIIVNEELFNETMGESAL